MAEILMVGGRGHLIAGVGHVLTAAIMLPEVVPGLFFFFWSFGFCGFFFGLVSDFCLPWSAMDEEEATSQPVLRRSGRGG